MTPPIDAAPPSADAGSALTELLTFRLARLAETISRASSLAYKARFGINNTELRVLVMLAGEGDQTISQLGRRMHIDKGWVSRSVDALTRRGILARRPHDTDSRAGLVSLSDSGRALIAALAPVARERHDLLLEGLDAAAVERLVTDLERRVEILLRSS